MSEVPGPAPLAGVDLRHLRCFVALAEERSFTAAARRLKISQPSLSTTIQQMERAIGAAVVERNRPVALTRAGSTALEHARPVLAAVAAMHDALAPVVQRRSLPLRVGVFAAGAGPLTTDLLRAFADVPGLDVALCPVGTEDHVRQLLDDSLDVVLAYGPVTDERIRVTPLSQERRMAVVGTRHTLAGAGRIGVADLLDQPVAALAPGESRAWDAWWNLVPERGEQPRRLPRISPGTDGLVQVRQSALRPVVTIVASHLAAVFPAEPNGLVYLPIVDASPASGVMLTRRVPDPMTDLLVACARRLTRAALNRAAAPVSPS